MKKVKKTLFKRFYFPGMISLVCLPLLCIGYFAYLGQFQKWAAMDVYWADDASIKMWNKYTEDKVNIDSFKKYPDFNINGNANSNKIILQKVEDICKRIVRDKEYGKGVTVNFTDKSKYRDLVNVLDAGYSLKGMSLIPYNDQVFFTLLKPYKRKTKVMAIDQGGLIMCGTFVFQNEPSLFNKSITFLKPYFIFWPSIIAFLLMLVFAFNRKRNIQSAN